jgi:hypothetical protein
MDETTIKSFENLAATDISLYIMRFPEVKSLESNMESLLLPIDKKRFLPLIMKSLVVTVFKLEVSILTYS